MGNQNTVEKRKQELVYLLKFFEQDQLVQWEQVPDTIEPVWIHTGSVDTDSEVPIEILALILYSHIDSRYCHDFQDSGLLEVLTDLRVLLDFMYESRIGFIFTKREELAEIDRLWRIVQRLCSVALAYDEVKAVVVEGISFTYFVGRYTTPWRRNDPNRR